jgi:hypothetical protein
MSESIFLERVVKRSCIFHISYQRMSLANLKSFADRDTILLQEPIGLDAAVNQVKEKI